MAEKEVIGERYPTTSSRFRLSWSLVSKNVEWLAWFYLALIALAEVINILVSPTAGMVMEGLILVGLFLHASRAPRNHFQRFLLCLTLVPLIRLLSLSLPLQSFPVIYRYAVIGLLLFIAVYIFTRVAQLNAGMLGLKFSHLPAQILIGISGIAVGYVQYRILRPEPLMSGSSWEQIWLPGLILLVFTGLLEELIFRGALQYTAIRTLGIWGLIYAAAMSTVLHFGYASILNVLFVFAVAVYFGLVTWRTGSILGVSVAHGISNVFLLLVFPVLFATSKADQPPPGKVTIPAVLATPSVIGTLSLFGTSTPAIVLPGDLTLALTQTPGQSISPTLTIISPTATIVIEATLTPTLTVTNTPENTATPTECSPPEDWVVYRVQPGDTLDSLAQRFGVRVKDLKEANCIDSNRIRAGQKLYVPYIAPPVPSSTPPPPLPTETEPPPPPPPSATLSPMPTTEVPPPPPTELPTEVIERPTPTPAPTLEPPTPVIEATPTEG